MNRVPQNHNIVVTLLYICLSMPFVGSTTRAQDVSPQTPKKTDIVEDGERDQQEPQEQSENNPTSSETTHPSSPPTEEAPDAPNAPNALISEDDREALPDRGTEASAAQARVVAPQTALSSESQNRPTEMTVDTPPDGAPPKPAPPLPLIPTASFFTRYELREGQRKIPVPSPRVGEMDAVAYRARFGLATTPMEVTDCLKTQIQFTPQASGFWQAGGLEDASLGLHEGVLRLLSCHVALDLGRMELKYGEHLVIGDVGWHQTGRSFDGARLRIGTDPNQMWVDLLALAVAEGLTEFVPTIGAGDKYLTGVYAGVGPMIGEKVDLDFYALVHILPKTEIPEEDLEPGEEPIGEAAADVTLGARLKLRVSMLDFRSEGGVQVGERRASPSLGGTAREVLAFQIDGEVGVNLLDDALRIAPGGLFASGDDPGTQDKIEAWDQLYPTAHRWLGFSDIMGGRSNVAGPFFRLSYQTPFNVRFTLDGHMFFRPEEVTTIAEDGSPVVTENGHAANEIDAGAAYSIGQGLKLRTLYALFLPDDDVYPSNDPVHFFELELRYDLK